ncbi:hypothetical protein AAW14_21990 [Streptomyces hygroscopicus]|uniref:hypothetical protein n=1 Tax=Streptomyces hygroscopicus TaxID=1912 RepID=UPI0022409F56|nr:hypothetical protein [Streptomyces hygroscopicus]MCW7944605.1 hypothetical protein [Streptomyces hygroscopicus]
MASSLPLGEPLLLGGVLLVPEGLAEGLVEGGAVCEGELGRPLEGTGVGPVFAGGGAWVVADGGEAVDPA